MIEEAFKLADGSLSSEYSEGDKFEVMNDNDSGGFFSKGDVVYLTFDDGDDCPWFSITNNRDDEFACYWSRLKPLDNKKSFTKADLKDGVTVILRNGTEAHSVDGGHFVSFRYDTYNSCEYQSNILDYTDDFIINDENEHQRQFDIIKVSYMGEVLWEREEGNPNQERINEIEKQIVNLLEEKAELEGENNE